MTEKRHVVKVRIVGEEYTLRTDEEPEHVLAVAEYLDAAIQKVSSSGVLEANRAAIMAALQITDELLKLRSNVEQSDAAMRALSAEIRRLLPPAKRGRDSEFASGEHAQI